MTGPSGAGRSTAINALEDLGFEAIDNLPLDLVRRLFSAGPPDRPIAIGVDARTRDFSVANVVATLEELQTVAGLEVSLVYLDCATGTLLRRFSETRRKHPLAPQDTPLAGIEREQEILASLSARADVLIDTSDMSPHELRREIGRLFGADGGQEMAISIQSFSFKRGTPRSADMMLDVRFLRNPHWAPELRPLTGQADEVVEHIKSDPLYAPFIEKGVDLLRFLLPAWRQGRAGL